jgi:predicted O-methyltransferase YrrM
MAVVDGNHRYDAVFVDLYYLGRLLRPGGIVFIDDYYLPGIAKAVAFLLTNLRWSLEEVSTAHHRHHWAVVRTLLNLIRGTSSTSLSSEPRLRSPTARR